MWKSLRFVEQKDFVAQLQQKKTKKKQHSFTRKLGDALGEPSAEAHTSDSPRCPWTGLESAQPLTQNIYPHAWNNVETLMGMWKPHYTRRQEIYCTFYNINESKILLYIFFLSSEIVINLSVVNPNICFHSSTYFIHQVSPLLWLPFCSAGAILDNALPQS